MDKKDIIPSKENEYNSIKGKSSNEKPVETIENKINNNELRDINNNIYNLR